MKNLQKKPSILIVGLFLSASNRHKIQRTPADQLAELFNTHGIATITTSKWVPRLARLIDTITTIIFNRSKYQIAIVPFYGGFKSFVWESITVSLLSRLNKKIVLIVHGGAIPERMKTKASKYLGVMGKVDCVICPSPFMQNELERFKQPSLVVENWINLEEYIFHHKEKIRPRILWMRAFEHPYNPLMAVRVLSCVKKEYAEATMVMAGFDFGMLQQTKNLAQQLGVLNAIEFPGYITSAQKNNFAERCDVYICTNKIDNAPISIIEMMALGVPVVTVNAGGIPYLVKAEHDCLMVQDDDAEAMAKEIMYLMQAPQKVASLTSNARLSAQRFGAEAVMKKWETIINQLSN